MTRFPGTGRDINVTGGGALTVRVSNPLAWNNLSTLVSLHLEAALVCLERTDRLLRRAQIPQGGRMVTLANRYFLTGPANIAAADLVRIQTVVTKIWNGLKANNVFIKTGQVIGARKYAGQNAMGAVPYKYEDEDDGPTKPYQNSVVKLDTGKTVTAKAIELHTDSFQHPGFGTANLIHEASHKFAGTIDYMYFNWGGFAPISPPNFTDKNRALMNADSYGYFILAFGMRGRPAFDWSTPLTNPV